jgi:F0F1-type ATP synthase assembly protein I
VGAIAGELTGAIVGGPPGAIVGGIVGAGLGGIAAEETVKSASPGDQRPKPSTSDDE